MSKDNYFARLLLLLLLTMAFCFVLYFLPDQLFGYKIKRVDLLSDIRVESASSLDSLRLQLLAEAETSLVDSAALRDSLVQARGIDSVSLALRDSLYRAMYAEQGADSLGTRIEDYSPGHTGLKRFFAALNAVQTLKRPVRVAFLGDSFIEGDILVADFRAGMQKQFGGRGVGFVPIASAASQFRTTIEQRSQGWTIHSMLTDRTHLYTLPGMLFEAAQERATVNFKNVNRYPRLQTVSSLKFLYTNNKETSLHLNYNGLPDTVIHALPATTTITQFEQNGSFTEGSLTFTQAKGFQALGVALEDNSGVVIDNFSIRGNSGLMMERLSQPDCEALGRIRPYDLIILQYGLNVVSDSVLQYNWYRERMVRVVQHVQRCFPMADILLLGVSDRSHQDEGEFETMPAVLALLHAQRQSARQVGIPFWNVFGAMGGENSMVRFVANNWASKDYTHLSFRGGREVAAALLKAILLEKEFYDKAEKAVY
ncbi:MAG: hypothetical protein RRZ65_07340 [Tannerellaceae bacterium]